MFYQLPNQSLRTSSQRSDFHRVVRLAMAEARPGSISGKSKQGSGGSAKPLGIGPVVMTVWCGVLYARPPIRSNVCKVFKRKDLRPDFPVQARG